MLLKFDINQWTQMQAAEYSQYINPTQNELALYSLLK